MFSILVLFIFYNDYTYGMAALAIYTIIIVTSGGWLFIFTGILLERKIKKFNLKIF